MAVCPTDVPAGEETVFWGPQHFYAITQSKSASCSMHRKGCAEIAATTICCFFRSLRILTMQRVIFLTGSLCLGLQTLPPEHRLPRSIAAQAHTDYWNREVKINRILPPRDLVLPGKSYSLQR